MIGLKDLGDVVLFDIAEGIPQGKALDIAQSSPVDGFDARCTGVNDYAGIEGADVVHRHRRRAAQAGHEPRRPARHQPQGHGAGRRRHQEVRARRPSSSASPTRSTPWCGRCRNFPACRRAMSSAWPACSTRARFRYFLAEEFKVSVEDVTAFVLGGHGDSMVPLTRYSTVAGIPLPDLVKMGWTTQGEARPDRPAHPRRRRRDRRPAEDRLGLLRAGGLGHRDGRSLSQGQEAGAALRRASVRPVWRQGHLCRRAGGDRRRRRRADHRDRPQQERAEDVRQLGRRRSRRSDEACVKIAPHLARSKSPEPDQPHEHPRISRQGAAEGVSALPVAEGVAGLQGERSGSRRQGAARSALCREEPDPCRRPRQGQLQGAWPRRQGRRAAGEVGRRGRRQRQARCSATRWSPSRPARPASRSTASISRTAPTSSASSICRSWSTARSAASPSSSRPKAAWTSRRSRMTRRKRSSPSPSIPKRA